MEVHKLVSDTVAKYLKGVTWSVQQKSVGDNDAEISCGPIWLYVETFAPSRLYTRLTLYTVGKEDEALQASYSRGAAINMFMRYLLEAVMQNDAELAQEMEDTPQDRSAGCS